MKKEGFIYIWYDKKRKMFYIGSHWGTVNDGYICSSNRMRDAYRRRPQDFKRRIIQKDILRENLLNEEHKWLSMILDNQLGIRYYNLRKHKWGHWSTDINKRLSIGQKISLSPNRRLNISLANKGRKPAINTKEAAIKSMKGLTYEEIHGIEKAKELKLLRSKSLIGRKHSEKSKQKMREARKK